MNLHLNMPARTAAWAALAAGLLAAAPASAGQKWEFGPDAWLSVGAGMRASYTHDEDADDEDDFTLNSARIFVNGQFTKVVGFTFNTEIDVDSDGDINDIRMMDAILRLEFNDAFNIYGGRMLAPSDRANLDGPYYLGTWEYPLVSIMNYPAIFQGRDNGAAAWGYVADKRLYYAAGVFAGCTDEDSSCYNDDADSPLLAARFTYNFWDRESGYYTSSDYYGEKEVLAIGLVGQFQADAVTGLGGETADYAAFNIDFLMQKRVFGNHVFTLEGAYYYSDTEGVLTTVPTGVVDGDGFFVLTSFLIDHKVGIGKFQPVFRYQEYSFDNAAISDFSEWSIGTNYIIKGHDARLSAIYSELDSDDPDGDTERFIAGVQLQF
jgi:hypothetical protein